MLMWLWCIGGFRPRQVKNAKSAGKSRYARAVSQAFFSDQERRHVHRPNENCRLRMR